LSYVIIATNERDIRLFLKFVVKIEKIFNLKLFFSE